MGRKSVCPINLFRVFKKYKTVYLFIQVMRFEELAKEKEAKGNRGISG
jgi:hypothetical protein